MDSLRPGKLPSHFEPDNSTGRSSPRCSQLWMRLLEHPDTEVMGQSEGKRVEAG